MIRRALACVLCCLALAGCVTSPPTNPRDICAIFEEKDDWYEPAQQAAERWDTSIPVMMAIMYQESGYRADARPPRRWLLWVIPWFRPSDAYGYPQALDSTWATYKRATGSWGADRDDFEDAIDFVGWYNHVASQQCRIRPEDGYRQYLAYHEGFKGYNRRTYVGKGTLEASARRVQQLSQRYHQQLEGCEDQFKNRGGWWPF